MKLLFTWRQNQHSSRTVPLERAGARGTAAPTVRLNSNLADELSDTEAETISCQAATPFFTSMLESVMVTVVTPVAETGPARAPRAIPATTRKAAAGAIRGIA